MTRNVCDDLGDRLLEVRSISSRTIDRRVGGPLVVAEFFDGEIAREYIWNFGGTAVSGVSSINLRSLFDAIGISTADLDIHDFDPSVVRGRLVISHVVEKRTKLDNRIIHFASWHAALFGADMARALCANPASVSLWQSAAPRSPEELVALDAAMEGDFSLAAAFDASAT